MRHLKITVTFLAGTYSGVEWPPSPARLAQAIVAGAESTQAPGLAWIEQQQAPAILATVEPDKVMRRDYVPLNATPGNESRNARDRIIRRQVQPVSYVWPVPAGAEGEALALAASAALITNLGSGQDMAIGRGELVEIAPQAAGEVHLWSAIHGLRTDADGVLDTPAPGMMAELARRHSITTQGVAAIKSAGFWSPQGGRSTSDGSGFAPVAYRPSHAIPRAALVAYSLKRMDGSVASWRAGQAVEVAGMVRHALIGLAGNDEDLGRFASGHPVGDQDCRASIVPVPSTGHEHADGKIRRVLVTSRPVDSALLARLLSRGPRAGLTLIDAETGEVVAVAIKLDGPRDEPVLRQILQPHDTWASVQPIILPTFDDGRDEKARKLVRKALAHAGIDPGLAVRIDINRREGYLPQSVRYSDVRIKARQSWANPAVHLRIRFSQPVSGPITLGQGRGAGVGALAPVT